MNNVMKVILILVGATLSACALMPAASLADGNATAAPTIVPPVEAASAVETAVPDDSQTIESELPQSCFTLETTEPGSGPFVNLQDGYCFQYPAAAGFTIKDVLPIGVAAVWGPPLTPSFEPLRSGLTVQKEERTGDRTLDEVVSTVLALNPEAEVVDSQAAFAGEQAQIVAGIPGMMDSQRYYLLHDGWVYVVTLVPLTQPGEFEAAVIAQRDLLWETVSTSFSWLPEDAGLRFADCPLPDPDAASSLSPYINLSYGFCLQYPGHYAQQDGLAQNTVLFSSPALDPTMPDPLRTSVMIMVQEEANGRSIQEVVDDLISSTPDLPIEQENAELGGEPAIILTGLPARQEGRDLFAVHNDLVYRVRIDPLGFPELAVDLEATWEVVRESFHFIDPRSQ